MPPLQGINVALMLETGRYTSVPTEKAWCSCFPLRLKAFAFSVRLLRFLPSKGCEFKFLDSTPLFVLLCWWRIFTIRFLD